MMQTGENMEQHQNKTINLTIDGFPVSVPAGTTILQAAEKINVKIPTLCDYPDLCKRALCRICVVECDGRDKLIAACAAEVSEGVRVVTGNLRVLGIRKTILKLLLANHPNDCLACVKSQNCELQKLAITYGIRETPFRQTGKMQEREMSGETLVRDMGKCVKCGRCVEVCQEIQNAGAINSSNRSVNFRISSPYGQDLEEGPCVFCGKCASVCPVGALYPNDQSAEVIKALNDSGQSAAAQVAPSAAKALTEEAGLLPGSITTGKITSALKTLGFKKVYAADYAANIAIQQKTEELISRIKNKGRLPMISACSPGWNNFVKQNYPDLMEHNCKCENQEQVFGAFARDNFGTEKTDPEKITAVSITTCLSKKYKAKYALVPAELTRLFYMKGIEPASQPEEPFDIPAIFTEADSDAKALKAALESGNNTGINETAINLAGHNVKILTVNGIANARKIMDQIREGKCGAALVDVRYCPECKSRKLSAD